MKKGIIGIVLTLVAAMLLTAMPLTGSAAGKDYSTDFSSEADLADWRMMRDEDGDSIAEDFDGYKIKDGFMTPVRAGKVDGAAYTGAKYKNFLIETSIDKMMRIQFCMDEAHPWAKNRFYVEIDFGGAIICRVGDGDVEIGSALVSGLVSREQTEVKIRVYGKTIEVYLHGARTPSFVRVDEDGTFTAKEGYIGIMTVWQNPSIDYFKITELDDNGLVNGKNPITGKTEGVTSESAPVSSTPEEKPVESTTPVTSQPEASTPSEETPAESTPEETPSEDTPAQSEPEESTAPTDPSLPTDDGAGNAQGPNLGLIIGIIAGVVAVAAVVVVVIILSKKKKG